MDTIIVKHSRLSHWTAFKEMVHFYAETKDSEESKAYLKLAKDYVKSLNSSKFFLTYPELLGQYQKLHRTLYERYDRKPEEIQSLLKNYFNQKLMGKNKNPTFIFEEKTEGMRAGVVCVIKYQDSTVQRFYIKTNHDADRSGSTLRSELDMRELFVYRLLETLGIGAKIHFPTSFIGSKILICIASLEIKSFRTFDELETKEKDHEVFAKPAIQILSIFTVLSLGDYHSKNMGIDEAGNPYIVDFCMGPMRILDLKTDLHNHIRCANLINIRINENSLKDRIKIGADFMRKLDFEKNLDAAYRYFMENDKKMFDNEDFPANFPAEENLNQYIKVIKENLEKFHLYAI